MLTRFQPNDAYCPLDCIMWRKHVRSPGLLEENEVLLPNNACLIVGTQIAFQMLCVVYLGHRAAHLCCSSQLVGDVLRV